MVDAVDVVARLADHQQNVPQPEARSTAVVVCLPAPPIEAALGLRATMDAHRRARCEALAVTVGGGDGPAAVTFLAGDSAVVRALAAWRDAGVTMLHVVGARAQPAWARALLARWRGGLCIEHAVDAALEHDLHDALAQADVTLSDALPGAGPSYARDRDGVMGCWRGFVPPRACFAAEGALRDAWVAHWGARGGDAEVRAALLGHDPALDAALRQPRERMRFEHPVTVAITGVDGSGKSTQVAALADALRATGLRVRVIKLYRQGAFLQLANALSGRTRGGASLTMFRTSRVVKLVDSLRVWRDEVLPALERSDVIVFDRYLETHEAAAAAQLAWDISAHPCLAVFPRVDVEFLLRIEADVALSRIERRDEPPSADEHRVGLLGYATHFDRIAARDGFVVLDALRDRDALARDIYARVEPLLARGGRAIEGTNLTPAAAPRGGGEGLVLGGDVADGAPGDDVCALASFVRRVRPDIAEGIAESFWLEAYAAQVLLDLRATGHRGAELPWWPAALLREPIFADLGALAELERMTLAHAPVTRVWLGGDGAARRIRALLGDGAGRVALLYDRALVAHAHEHAWAVDA